MDPKSEASASTKTHRSRISQSNKSEIPTKLAKWSNDASGKEQPGAISLPLEIGGIVFSSPVERQRLVESGLNAAIESSKRCQPQESFPHEPMPVLNTDVLDHIFTLLDYKSLKNCRLVSKTWNEEASHRLGKKSWFSTKTNSNYNSDWGQMDAEEPEDWEDYRDYAEETDKLLANISSISLCQNLAVVSEDLNRPQFVKQIKAVGPSVKCIKVNNIIQQHQKNLHHLLTKWCSNLSDLTLAFTSEGDICTCGGLNGEERCKNCKSWNETLDFKIDEPLNLKKIVIEGNVDHASKFRHSNHWINYLIKLFQACPNLDIIRVPCPSFYNYKSYRVQKNRLSIIKELAHVPEVTRNLQEFSWDAENPQSFHFKHTEMNILKVVLTLKFSSKLKTFGFGSSTNISDSSNRSTQLIEVLKKLNSCRVENIFFGGMYKAIYDLNMPTKHLNLVSLHQVPKMRSVKTIKILSKNNYGLGCILFVTKFPNLVKLDMNPEIKGLGVDSEQFISELHELRLTPHDNLKTLIVNPHISKLSTLDLIMKCFPNLQCFYIKLHGISFKDALLSTTDSLIDLKELTIRVVSKCKPGDVCDAMSLVKDFHRLEKLTLEGVSSFCKPMSFSTAKNAIDTLSSSSSCLVRLVGHGLKKSDGIQLEKYSEDKRLLLKILDESEGPDGFFNFRGYQDVYSEDSD